MIVTGVPDQEGSSLVNVRVLLHRDRVSAPLPPLSCAFPGMWIGGISLILAPLCLLVGELLKVPYYYYFPAQLQAFAAHPTQMHWPYTLYTIGFLALWPGLIMLASLICRTRPWLGRITGMIAIVGVLVNTFYQGINHLAFELTEVNGVEPATAFIRETYGWFSVAYVLTWTDNLGWVLLGVAAYYTRTFGWFRALCVICMAARFSGVLKGYSIDGIIENVLLCLAFGTLGPEILRGRFAENRTTDRPLDDRAGLQPKA
jgi:hypothetical protein